MSRFYLKVSTFAALILFLASISASGVVELQRGNEDEFGPVVRAYLGYLRNEQEVVDDRVSRREVSASYYRRNSNRIRALRQMALRIARQSRNDYLPELEAVARNEFGLLFEKPPVPESLRVGEILRGTFRFLGTARSSEVFYIFARLDPYEQAELQEQRQPSDKDADPNSENNLRSSPAASSRERRVTSP